MVATNHNSKNVGIWLGCGHTDKGQLSFLDLNTERYTFEVNTNIFYILNMIKIYFANYFKLCIM